MSAPLHIVQISRDMGLATAALDSEPVQRQVSYARELGRRSNGASMTILLLASGDRAAAWRHHNLEVVPIASSLRGRLECVRTLHTLHKAKPIGVITTQVPYDEGWLALVAGYWHRIPVIAQIHSDLFSERPSLASRGRALRALRDWLARRTLSAFSAVRTVSSESRAAVTRFAAAVPQATIPVPVPMLSRRARPLPQQPREPLVVFVGRLAPEKDLSTWLRVASAVSKEHPEVRFELYGEGPERPRLEREVEQLGLSAVTRFVGFTPYAELQAVYARAAALLLTSREEGFGRVLVEAASQGTPAVSTSLSGPREVVINGVTGFLHEPGDVHGLARSVSMLVAQPHRAAAMGSSARALVAAKFDPERLRAAWVDLWIDTAAGRCAS